MSDPGDILKALPRGRGLFIAVAGASGAGKDTILRCVAGAFANEPRVQVARRVITRPADAGGEAHEAVSAQRFAEMEARGGFALCWAAHGLCYGIPVSVDAAVDGGAIVLANVSRGRLREAMQRYSRMVAVHVTAHPQVLAARLAARGREDDAAVRERLKRAAGLDIPRERVLEIDNSGTIDTAVSAVEALLAAALA